MASADMTTAKTVTSRDGTTIAYEVTGAGPALILVDAAGHYRAFSSFTGLIGLLAGHFTVYHYDRRGRGDSTDTPPYAVEREVEDLAALIDRAGGSAFLYGYSSGGLLALHAAASGLPVAKIVLFEPPFETGDDRSGQAAFTAQLAELVRAGRPGAAVEHFLTSIGVPDEVMALMRNTASWLAMESVAHTLIYDSVISEGTCFQLLASVTVPTLVLQSESSGDELIAMSATIADAMPDASHRGIAGEWHAVADDVLADALREFFSRSGGTGAGAGCW
jgi:pimeloyl-ACP methyl ester carboxylesterase